MDLTARHIHEKQFHDAWRGYNQEEVDDFLDKVAETLDRLQRENRALQARIRELDQVVATSRDTEEMLKKTLVTAQQAAEEAIASAKAKAEQLLTEAEQRAIRANEEAKEKVAAAEVEARRKSLEADREHQLKRRDLDANIEKLRAFESELKQRLTAFMQQQLRALESLTETTPAQKPAGPAQARPQGPPAAGQGPAGGRDPLPGAPQQSVAGQARVETEPTRVPARPENDPAARMIHLPRDPEPARAERRGVRGIFNRDDP